MKVEMEIITDAGSVFKEFNTQSQALKHKKILKKENSKFKFKIKPLT